MQEKMLADEASGSLQYEASCLRLVAGLGMIGIVAGALASYFVVSNRPLSSKLHDPLQDAKAPQTQNMPK